MQDKINSSYEESLRSIKHKNELYSLDSEQFSSTLKSDQGGVQLDEISQTDSNQSNYIDVFEMYTNCSEEYKEVFRTLEILDICLKNLINKVDSQLTVKIDLVSSIMHKELANNIYSELQRFSLNLRKSKFFSRLLDQSSWKKELKKELTQSFNSTSKQPTKPSSILQSKIKQTIPKHQPLYFSERAEVKEKLTLEKPKSSLGPKGKESLGIRVEPQTKEVQFRKKTEQGSSGTVN